MNRGGKSRRELEYDPSGKDTSLSSLSLCGYRPPEEYQVHVSALAKDWRESVNHDSSSFLMYTSLYCGSERMENRSTLYVHGHVAPHLLVHLSICDIGEAWI